MARPKLGSYFMTTGAEHTTAKEIQRRLGRAVRSARMAKALTQEEVARRSGFGWRHIQKIEAGEVNATLRTICKLAAAVGVDPGALLSQPDKG
jgi:transcriptional regulator with XRE-family HTH domain